MPDASRSSDDCPSLADVPLPGTGVDVTPYARARARFLTAQGVVPNAFLVSPDCYAVLRRQAETVAVYEFTGRGVPTLAPPNPSAFVWGFPLYVVPGLPTGTILAVLV